MNYIVVPKGWTRVKIGYWNGKPEGLRNRYVCPYGSDLEIITVHSIHYKKLEALFKLVFENKCITNELFQIDYVQQYIDFFESHKDNNLDEINEKIDDLLQQKVKSSVKKQTFSKDLLLSDEMFNEVYNLNESGDATHYQKQQVWTSHLVKDIWKIDPTLVDQQFYEKYIGDHGDLRSISQIKDRFKKIQRLALIVKNSVVDDSYVQDVKTLLLKLLFLGK
jgi:hypothetical protein